MATLMTLYTIERRERPLNTYYVVWVNEHVFDYYTTLEAAQSAVRRLRELEL